MYVSINTIEKGEMGFTYAGWCDFPELEICIDFSHKKPITFVESGGSIKKLAKSVVVVDPEGTIRYYNKQGKLHRAGDKPAIEHINGDKEWFVDGERHRDGDKPAVSGNKVLEWWLAGHLHRDNDKPAVIWGTGDREYWSDGCRYKYGYSLHDLEKLKKDC